MTKTNEITPTKDVQPAVPMSDEVVGAEFAAIVAHEDNHDLVEMTHDEHEYDTRTERVAAKLGKFAAKISIAAGSLREKLTPSSINAHATLGALGAIDKVKSAFNKASDVYMTPLHKMEKDKTLDRKTRAKRFIGRWAYRSAIATTAVVGLQFAKMVGGDAHAAIFSINGHGGGSSNAFNDVVNNSTIAQGERSTPVHWSAEMGDGALKALFPNDELPTHQSGVEGAQRISEAIGNNPQGDTLVGYSQGTMASVEYLRANPEYLENNGAILVGGPYTPDRRLADNPLYKLVAPLVPETSKVLEYESPAGESVLYIVNEDDPVWLKNGNPVGILAGVLDPNSHAYTSADLSGQTPHIVIHNEDGSTSHILTETKTRLADGSMAKSGISAGITHHTDYEVSRKADNFFEALDGDPVTGRTNVAEVVDAAGPAAQEMLAYHGVNPQHADMIGQAISNLPVEPLQKIADQVLDIPNRVAEAAQTQVPAPAPAVAETTWQPAPAPASTWTPPAAPAWTPPAVTPEYVNQGVQQVETFVNDTANAVKTAAGGNEQVTTAVNNATTQINGAINNLFGLR